MTNKRREAIDRVRRLEKEICSAKDIEDEIVDLPDHELEDWLGLDDQEFIEIARLISQLDPSDCSYHDARAFVSKKLTTHSLIKELVMLAIAKGRDQTKKVRNGKVLYEVIVRRVVAPNGSFTDPEVPGETSTDPEQPYKSINGTWGALSLCVIDVLQREGREMNAAEIYDRLLSGGFEIQPPKNETAVSYLGIRLYKMKGVQKLGDGLFTLSPNESNETDERLTREEPDGPSTGKWVWH